MRLPTPAPLARNSPGSARSSSSVPLKAFPTYDACIAAEAQVASRFCLATISFDSQVRRRLPFCRAEQNLFLIVPQDAKGATRYAWSLTVTSFFLAVTATIMVPRVIARVRR
jgi:hypothetical protein